MKIIRNATVHEVLELVRSPYELCFFYKNGTIPFVTFHSPEKVSEEIMGARVYCAYETDFRHAGLDGDGRAFMIRLKWEYPRP